ncbi:MAG TPA: hypothetical protein VFU81_00165, partial [Thermomicrobiales bacterium]|nr:hypothetical protein [Thermomicrobiales bacterium]
TGDNAMTETSSGQRRDCLPPRWALPWAPTRDELLRRLRNVLEFAATNVRLIDRHATHWRDDDDPYVSQADKTIVETALLLLVAARVDGLPDEIDRLIRDLARRLVPLARSERNQVLLMRYPQTAASLGITHTILTRLGLPDGRFEVLMERAFASGHVDAIERLPYRLMDLRWLRGLAEPNGPPDFSDVLPHSVAASCAHPVQMSPADTYALTHDLMYMSDFGDRPLPPSLDADRVSATIDAAIAFHLLTDNLDLLGELLIGATILGRPWSPHARYGWSVLTTVWDELGFLPCPTFEKAAYAELAGERASAYVFRHVYHTMYVAGILCALSLRQPAACDAPGSKPPARRADRSVTKRAERCVALAMTYCRQSLAGTPPGEDVAAGQAGIDRRPDAVDGRFDAGSRGGDALAAVVASLGRHDAAWARPDAPWRSALAGASLTEHECVDVLLDALLIHAARDYALGAVAESLVVATGRSTPLSPTAVEAMAFLVRQQLPSGAIGAHLLGEGVALDDPIGTTARLALAIARAAARLDADLAERAAKPIGG